VDSFNDASGISSGSSSGYSWRTSPNYDVVRDANYTDQTGTGATSASSSWNQTSYHPDKAVDNSSATGWLSAAVPSTSSPQWWKYDFGSGNAKTIKRVTFQQSNDNPAYYMPKDFSIQASNDDTNWTTLLTPASQTGWTSQEKRTFDFSNATAYRYWRIHITAKESGGEGVQLGEVELMTQASGSATIVSTVYSVFSAPTEAMVTADETLGAGSVTYYVSRDNGTTWTECAKDTVTSISAQPTGTQLKWKAVITGDAELNAIAVAI